MSDWISVKDRVPENEGDVLVTTGKIVRVAFYSFRDKEFCNEFGFLLRPQPNYWMHMPELPEVVE